MVLLSPEWYTPKKFIESVTDVLGDIDLDPASCQMANEIVQAFKFYSKEDDGLKPTWRGKVYLNPPYGRAAQPFIFKLVDEFLSGHITEAILLINSSTETGYWQYAFSAANAICFPDRRIQFVDEEGNVQDRPKQGSTFFYFGDRGDDFYSYFAQHGVCTLLK